MSAEPVARPHPEHVVLNVGGPLGALVVHWTREQLDTPIEISPTADDDDRQHQHILERPLEGHTFYAAVFDAIAAGAYTLWVEGREPLREVEIAGGAITELHWEQAPPRLR